MEKKIYETPQLEFLGSVKALTSLVGPPTNCSVVADQSSEDALCEFPS